MAMCMQLSVLLVLVCILEPSESQIGTACPPAGCSSVIPNSQCTNGACECQQGFYSDSGSDCLPKKGLGDSCTNNDECQDSSHCDGGHCATTVSTTTVSAATVNITEKVLGQSCIENDECQDSSLCDGGRCVADVNATTVKGSGGTTDCAGGHCVTAVINTADQNNPSNGARAVISIGDRAVVIQGFLQYVLVNRN